MVSLKSWLGGQPMGDGHTIALISHASKVMLKIPQARLQQYVNRELPDVQAGFRKGRGTIKRKEISFAYNGNKSINRSGQQ